MATASRRCSIASRTAAAVIGGYALAALLATALALTLPMQRVDAFICSAAAGLAAYAAAIIAAFHARSAGRAWAWIGLASIAPAAVVALAI